MRNTGRFLLLLGISVLMSFLHCRTSEPQPQITFDKLSPKDQARVRPFLKADANGKVDPDWWRIVRATCKVSPAANCACCDPKTAHSCNRTDWSCCASTVFPPADGSSCAYQDWCASCPPPPPPPRVSGDTRAAFAARSARR